MLPVKEELSNAASAANQKLEKAPARPEEEEMSDESRQAKDAQGKMEFHDQKYECPIPTPGGEYPMRQAATARGAVPTTGAATGLTRSRLDAMHRSHLHVHRREHECPIPTPGGEYPIRRATTANGSFDE